jgi:hypothetical protein
MDIRVNNPADVVSSGNIWLDSGLVCEVSQALDRYATPTTLKAAIILSIKQWEQDGEPQNLESIKVVGLTRDQWQMVDTLARYKADDIRSEMKLLPFVDIYKLNAISWAAEAIVRVLYGPEWED